MCVHHAHFLRGVIKRSAEGPETLYLSEGALGPPGAGGPEAQVRIGVVQVRQEPAQVGVLSVHMTRRAGRHLNPPERLAHEPYMRPLRSAAALSGGRTGRKSKVRLACASSGAGTSWLAHPCAPRDAREAI